jgi:hypothetical protein
MYGDTPPQYLRFGFDPLLIIKALSFPAVTSGVCADDGAIEFGVNPTPLLEDQRFSVGKLAHRAVERVSDGVADYAPETSGTSAAVITGLLPLRLWQEQRPILIIPWRA